MFEFYLLVIASVFMAAVSQMLLKKGASISRSSFVKDYLNLWVLCGYGLLGFSLLVNIFAMNHGVLAKEVSIIESLSYLFVPALSSVCFKERISLKKCSAIAVIIVGILVFFS